ncbi:MAG: polysaccharide deacetylase family protein [Thermoplasmataceae archaeon]
MSRFNWPNGYQACMCLSWDMDGESAFYFRNPEEAKMQLSELVQRSYGPNVGIYKILDMLDRQGVPGTFFVPGYTARLHPEAVEEITKRGHPVGIHGYMHETMEKLDDKEERDMFRASIKAIREVSGKKPKIFRSPSFELNRRTPEILLANGIFTDSSLMGDDMPYLMNVGDSKLLELPVQWIMDDFEFWGHTKSNRQKPISDPEATVRIWKNELAGIHENGGIFILTMHPFVSGRWVYLKAIEDFIKFAKHLPGLWIADMEEVSDYCLKPDVMESLKARSPPSPAPLDFKDFS